MAVSTVAVDYELKLTDTKAATGFFTCLPGPPPGFEQGLELLRSRPLDDFLHRYLLTDVLSRPFGELEELASAACAANDPFLLALLHEARLIKGGDFPRLPPADGLEQYSSLVYLRSMEPQRRAIHQRWQEVLKQNLLEHKLPVAVSEAGLPPLYRDIADGGLPDRGPELAERFAASGFRLPESDRRPLEDTLAEVSARLEALDVFRGPEVRHAASLSPIAYLRRWRLSVTVASGRNHYRLGGIQTSYGRGLSPEAARVSCLMEMVERLSSFVSVDGKRLVDSAGRRELVFGSRRQLEKRGLPVLDPNRMRLDVPYNQERLYWVEGKTGAGRSLFVPAQAVFLFSNLDEPGLFSGLGSTGLAAGNNATEARLAGLLEVVERDADASMPFDPAACFRLETANAHLQPLFRAYEEQGIAICFQDITTEFGIPCYRCFVRDRQGKIIRGTGAHLDGRRAAMAALTETGYPFPAGPPSAPCPPGLPVRRFEDLPNFDTNRSAANLELVSGQLTARGFEPVYVDLTRKDLGFPVSRALVPGLEWLADFDRFATVSPRLYRNYCRLFA